MADISSNGNFTESRRNRRKKDQEIEDLKRELEGGEDEAINSRTEIDELTKKNA